MPKCSREHLGKHKVIDILISPIGEMTGNAGY
jgi:hypothetical protein